MKRTVYRLLVCALLVTARQAACDAQTANEQSAGTLPPVVVQPPSEADGGVNAPSVPPVDAPLQSSPERIGETNATAQPEDALADLPRLSELRLGESGRFRENTGIVRGSQSLFDTPSAASIRGRDEIQERQAPDMFQALQNEVGVLLQSTAAGQASPFIRGLTGQQVLILVDGIRLNNSIFRRGPNQYFNTIDPGMVNQIEVLRGQGSVLWGSDAIGGAINVVTRSADSHWGTYHSNYAAPEFTQYYNTSNSSPYSRLNFEGWAGQTGIFGGGSFLNVRDLDTAFDNFSRQPGTNYQQHAGDIKLNYLLSQDQLLTFALQHFEQENVPRSDRFPGYPLDRNNSNTFAGARFFDPQQRNLIYIRHQAVRPLGGIVDATTLTASYHRQREVQTRGVPTTRFQETDVETAGLQCVASKDLGLLGRWVTGADWYYDDVDSPFGGTANGPIVPDDAWYRRIGWFLTWDVKLTKRLAATAGVRFEDIETAGTPVVMNTPMFIKPSYKDWVGQVGMSYELASDVRLVGSISEGFRAPNLDDLMANNPNVLQQGQSLPSLGLTPEHSINYEVGVKTDFARFRSQTFVYWTDLQDNLVSITAAPNTFATANQDSFVQGVESSGQWLLDDGWTIYGNFWYTFGKNLVTQAPLSRVPPTQGILGLRYQARRHSYVALYTWMSRNQDRLNPVRDVADERIPIGGTPGFATLNVRAGRTFGVCDEHRVSLSLENLTDQPYIVHGSGVLGTGFTARFGYQWVY